MGEHVGHQCNHEKQSKYKILMVFYIYTKTNYQEQEVQPDKKTDYTIA